MAILEWVGRVARGPRLDAHVILNLDLLVLRAMDESPELFTMRHAGGVPARQGRAQTECSATVAWHQTKGGGAQHDSTYLRHRAPNRRKHRLKGSLRCDVPDFKSEAGQRQCEKRWWTKKQRDGHRQGRNLDTRMP